jgi:hypothetical protein
MYVVNSRNLFLFFFILLLTQTLLAQESVIEASKRTIALDEPFVIKLIIKSSSLKNTYSAFPQIQGMLKRDISSSTATTAQNGQTIIIQTITQTYLASKQGSFLLKPFTMIVNGETIQSAGYSIRVGPAADPNYIFKKELYDELMEIEKNRNVYKDIQADAFFSITTTKDNVYVGEGVTVMLAFYVAETNKAELQFYKVGEQLIEILKNIRPANCWEENFNIEEFQQTSVVINQKKYDRYAIYQAIFYPLNTKPILFPEVGLTMITYKVTQNPDPAAVKKKEELKTFFTRAKKITVKPLPEHPLQEQVPVGVFRLKESVSNRNLQTGKTFAYQFDIIGEGNFSTVDLKPKNSSSFDFYPPAIKQQSSRSGNKISGTKSFIFQIIPKEPGLHVLRNYFEWIYFDTQKEKYDTLSSAISVQVSGESQRNVAISLNTGPLYKNMLQESNRLRSLNEGGRVRMFANIFILFMIIVTLVLFFIKR